MDEPRFWIDEDSMYDTMALTWTGEELQLRARAPCSLQLAACSSEIVSFDNRVLRGTLYTRGYFMKLCDVDCVGGTWREKRV